MPFVEFAKYDDTHNRIQLLVVKCGLSVFCVNYDTEILLAGRGPYVA